MIMMKGTVRLFAAGGESALFGRRTSRTSTFPSVCRRRFAVSNSAVGPAHDGGANGLQGNASYTHTKLRSAYHILGYIATQFRIWCFYVHCAAPSSSAYVQSQPAPEVAFAFKFYLVLPFCNRNLSVMHFRGRLLHHSTSLNINTDIPMVLFLSIHYLLQHTSRQQNLAYLPLSGLVLVLLLR